MNTIFRKPQRPFLNPCDKPSKKAHYHNAAKFSSTLPPERILHTEHPQEHSKPDDLLRYLAFAG